MSGYPNVGSSLRSFIPSSMRPGLLAVALLLGVTGILAQPSQSPLLSQASVAVSPNLVLNLDDSGSMMYQHMPEGAFTLAGKSITLAGNDSLLMHPNDTRKFSPTFRGIWPANLGATGANLLYQQQVRSGDVNSIYYNPETVYKPWIKTDGTRFPAADPAVAPYNPMVAATVVPPTALPITFVGAGSTQTANSGNISPGLPSGVAANDFLICLVESFDGVTHTAPTGWTSLYNLTNSSAHSASAIYKLASGSDAAPTIGHVSGAHIVAKCFAYRGVDTASPFDVAFSSAHSATNSSTGASTIGSGSIATTANAGALILMASHQANDASSLNVTTTGGLAWTQAGIGAFNSVNDVAVGLHHAVKATVGAVSAIQVTSNQNGRNSGVLIALRRGPVPAVGTVVNGTNLMAPTGAVTADWCLAATGGCPSGSLSYTPMLYYRLQKNGDGTYKDPTVSANYDSYDLTGNKKNGGASPWPITYTNRTDCSAGGCTRAEEIQNYANWYVYHRSRLLIAQSALAESLWNVDGTKIRVGWGYINKGSGTVDGDTVSTVVAGVRDFNLTRKDAMFSFFRNIVANGGTPLQAALDGVGKYYSNASPWADDPSSPGVGTPKDCRRAYHLLVTDGLWNQTVSDSIKVGNYDGGAPSSAAKFSPTVNYPTISNSDNVSYTYVPAAPYSDGNTDYLADFASYYFNRDLRLGALLANNVSATPPNKLTWQGMVNLVVGIGLKGDLDPKTDLPALTAGTKTWGTNKVDDLWHAAVNSEGKYFSATNSTELATSLGAAIDTASKDPSKEAGVATTTNVLEAGTRKYVPLYVAGQWTGDIRAFKLNANGGTVVGPGPNGEEWSVASKLPGWGSRNIYTWNETLGAPSLFKWTDMGASNNAAFGPAAGSSDLVDFLKGNTALEDKTGVSGNPYRNRKSILGDFVNSNPVFIKAGTDLGFQNLVVGGTTYDSYRATKALRTGVLFAAGNDGMVHAFTDSLGATPLADGVEIFGYVPRAIYPNLTKLADKTYGTAALYHQFYIDGAFTEADAYIKENAAAAVPSWRNLLLGSLGAGGKAVLAFDVTNMTSPGAANIKWEFSGDVDLGYVSAPIEVGVLPDNTWVAIFGNGPMSTNGKAVLFVVNLDTGVAQKLEVNSSTGNGLGGVGVRRNTNGYIESLYAGDLTGKVWKLNYNAAAPSKFSVANSVPFFDTAPTATAQPITQAPMAFDGPGGKVIVFATGKLLVDADRLTTDTQTIYGVLDTGALTTTLDRSTLLPRTLTKVTSPGNSATFYGLAGANLDWSTNSGWMIDLTLTETNPGPPATTTNLFAGQRVIYPPQRFSPSLVLISSVSPGVSSSVCTAAEGKGANFILPVLSGKNPTNKMFDTDGNGEFNSSDVFVAGVATKVDGIDSVLTSPTLGGKCLPNEVLKAIENTEGAVLVCVEVAPPGGGGGGGGSVIQDRVLRRIINPPIR